MVEPVPSLHFEKSNGSAMQMGPGIVLHLPFKCLSFLTDLLAFLFSLKRDPS